MIDHPNINDLQQLGVVPIVVNAGAALLPAMLAAVATFLTLLFKPRELFRVCRERPAIPIAALVVVGLIVAAFAYWPSGHDSHQSTTGRRQALSNSPTSATSPSHGAAVYVDWTRVALARIDAKKRTALSPDTVTASTVVEPSDNNHESEQPFIFRVGPQRLGAIGAAPAVGLQRLWQHYPRWIDEAGVESEDTEAMILSSAAMFGERVYGASCLLDPPDTYGAIFCLDLNSGKQIWSVDKHEEADFKGFFSSPAISSDGRLLVIGQGLHPDSNCRLLCIETDSGRVRWTLATPLHLESSPVIDGDTVYIGAGAIEDPATHQPLSHPGYVLAASLENGSELWRHDVADPEGSPAVRDGVLFIGSGFNGNSIVALSTDPAINPNSRELWSSPTPYPITGAITLLDNLVIAGGGNGDFVYRDPNPGGVVVALDAKSGATVWQADMPDAVLGAVAAGQHLVCGVANGEVMALDHKDGKPLWAARISGLAPVLAAPAVTDSEVFAVSQNGYLARFDLATGKELEKLYINSEEKPGAQGLSVSSPLVVNGRLIVGSETGGLRAYAAGAGQ